MHVVGVAVPDTSALGSRVQPRLLSAAREFEAQMMKELLRPLTADAVPGPEGEGDASSSGALGEFASEALGRALSAQGGFGIADRLIHALSHSGTSSTPGRDLQPVSTSVHNGPLK